MGSLTTTKTGWRIRWRTPDGRQREERIKRIPGVTNKATAEKRKVEIEGDLAAGRYGRTALAGEHKRTTFADYADQWLDRQRHWRGSTRASKSNIVATRLVPFFGPMDVSRIGRHHCEQWVASMSDAPGSIRTYRATLTSIFRSAIRDGYLTTNPLDGVKLPNGDGAPVVALTPDQVDRVVSALPGHLRALGALQAGLGLRQGEACALTWAKIDLSAGKVVIDRQIDGNGRTARVDAPLKTRASYRTIPLPRPLRDALEAHRAEFGASNVHGLVSVTLKGSPVGRQSWAATFRSATQRAEVTATSHDLRHYCASRLGSAGVPVAAAARFMGHTPVTFLSVYSHWFQGDDDRILAALED